MFKLSGILTYYPNWWAVIYVCEDISKYYQKLLYMDNFIKINKQKYPAHISVVYGEKYNDVPPDDFKKNWAYNDKQEIEFEYDNNIFFEEPFWKILVRCNDLNIIRAKLGLPDLHCEQHITIGNLKGA